MFQIEDSTLQLSSIGGAFQNIARYFLKNNGIVYGSVMDSDFTVHHERSESVESILKQCKSKYVQSKVDSSIYSSLKDDVKTNRLVLFSGTPCQCAAVYILFGGDIPNNLFLVDIICHGVPSEWSFKKSISLFEKANNLIINSFSFRTFYGKNCLNKKFTISFTKRKKIKSFSDYYKYFEYLKKFDEGTIFRSSCYKCKFKGENRFSDFTLGDFWGLKNLDSDKNHYTKSLIICNNEKSYALLSKMDMVKSEYNFADSVKYNKSYFVSPDYKNYDFLEFLSKDKWCAKIYRKNYIQLSFRFLYKKIKKIVRRMTNE